MKDIWWKTSQPEKKNDIAELEVSYTMILCVDMWFSDWTLFGPKIYLLNNQQIDFCGPKTIFDKKSVYFSLGSNAKSYKAGPVPFDNLDSFCKETNFLVHDYKWPGLVPLILKCGVKFMPSYSSFSTVGWHGVNSLLDKEDLSTSSCGDTFQHFIMWQITLYTALLFTLNFHQQEIHYLTAMKVRINSYFIYYIIY